MCPTSGYPLPVYHIDRQGRDQGGSWCPEQAAAAEKKEAAAAAEKEEEADAAATAAEKEAAAAALGSRPSQ